MSVSQIHPCVASPASCAPRAEVLDWRAGRLRDAGFQPELADTVAGQRMDLHALLSLVDAGCPPHLAARILAPDDLPGERR